MAARLHLPGMRWMLWMRSVSMRTGILTGIYASCVFVAWLIVANRLSAMDRFAGPRNTLTVGILLLILGIPVLRFLHEPGRMFAAGLAAWTILTVTYLATEIYFTLLASRIGGFHLFTLGAVSYGIVAVFDWVFLMCAEARHAHMAHCREISGSAGKHRAN
jgi:hypothetical protein